MLQRNPGPVTEGERSAAPDLARGIALLAIAVANSVVHLFGHETGPSGRPLDAGTADRVVDFAAALLVDNRAYPLFAALFGYGVTQLLARQAAAGTPWPAARRLLARRNLWLIGFGFVHTALLFSGDILSLYGALGLILLLLLRSSDRTLLVWTGITLVPLAALSTFDGLDSEVLGGGTGSTETFGILAALAWRLTEFFIGLATVPFLGVGLLAPMLLGVWAGRRRLLDDPQLHLPLLRRVAALGLATGIAGGVPLALTSTGLWNPPTAVDVGVGALHGLTGVAGGLAYAALCGLAVAGRRGRAPGPVGTALAACGQRSLTCYLVQSVVFVPLLAPWALGYGGRLGTAEVAAIGAGIWVLTVVGAEMVRRAGRRGPAEVLLRRLTYGPDSERAGHTSTARQGRRRRSST